MQPTQSLPCCDGLFPSKWCSNDTGGFLGFPLHAVLHMPGYPPRAEGRLPWVSWSLLHMHPKSAELGPMHATQASLRRPRRC